ncbi:MAG: L,D-transpeptidase family protein, partial [Candidatus Binataceae bacterium]
MTAMRGRWWMVVAVAAMYFAVSPSMGRSAPPTADVAATEVLDGHGTAVDDAATNATQDGHANGAPHDAKAETTPGRKMYLEEQNRVDIQAPSSWAVMAYKSRQELVVYYKSRLYKKYHSVFGRNLDRSVKVYEGDRRTPEGAYRIISKETNPRFTRFLRIDYP